MREGFGSHSVCLFVYLSVTALAATYLVYTSKVWQHGISSRLLKICIVWTLLETFCSGDMVEFVCNNDRVFLNRRKTCQWFFARLQMAQYMNQVMALRTRSRVTFFDCLGL